MVLGLLVPTTAYVSKQTYADTAETLLREMRSASKAEDSSGEALLGEIEELTASTEPPADRLVRILHPWSSYVILPLFALANAGVLLNAHAVGQAFAANATWGIITGLVLGKFIGIVGFAYIAVRCRLAALSDGIEWRHMGGIGLLGGIGFTVSLFITDLAFTEPNLVEQCKLGVLAASLASGVAGYLFLRVFSRRQRSRWWRFRNA